MAHVGHCIDCHSSPLMCNCCFAIVTDGWARPVFVDERCTIAMPADDCSFGFALAFVVDQDWRVKRHV